MRITSLTKSAKGKLALTLLSGLAAFGATSVLGAPKPSFSVSASPATQTVTAGQNASYTVAIKRQNKHTGAVAMSVQGFPAGSHMTGSFNPPTVPASGVASTLTVNTNQGGTTPPGPYTLTVKGTSGSEQRTATVRLTVVGASQANFALSATPTQSVISAEDSTSHQIGIARSGGYSDAVGFSASGLPNGVSAGFSANPVFGNDTTLTFTSDHNPKPGTYTVTVTGIGFDAQELTRSVTVLLTVEEKAPFEIDGDAAQSLVPGSPVPLDMVVTNPHNFPLEITQLHVSVDPNTSAANCDGDDNYSVQQVPAADYPLTLPAHATRTLTQLGATKPTVTMNDLVGVNQDACKSATVFFNYTGAATK